MKGKYVEAIGLIAKVNHRLIEAVKEEFDRMGWDDINPGQAILMFNIGDAELSAGELRTRGYYLGSNVSYNLKRLIETNYLFQERSKADRRSIRIKLTPKGQEVAEVVDELYERHLKGLEQESGLSEAVLSDMTQRLVAFDKFLITQGAYRL